MEKYDHTVIEQRWQAQWAADGLFRARHDATRPKYYILTMFPYPSGTLHMGHVINYTLGDALVRYHIMKGETVLSPMGFDSFGLPAENAAIRDKVAPGDFTARNITRMREQMRLAGWGYDWDRELATSDPAYYRWTQWIFLQLFKAGLAFKKNANVNWCPSCQTVLANEQVKEDVCERCNTGIEQRRLNQWFFRMSAYAERLLANHAHLHGRWPDRVLKMQEEWIGRSEGTQIVFRLTGSGRELPIFTTRPDTAFGVTCMAISPHHPLLEELLRGAPQAAAVMARVAALRKQTVSIRNVEQITKEGVDTGLTVTNPLNGDQVPLWAANFVFMDYGTGVIMSVPAHDQRDFEFARAYGLPVKVVIQPPDRGLDPRAMTAAYTEPGLMVNSGRFNGLPNGEAAGAITDHLAAQGAGRRETHYRLKDWLLSRQRYWGAPIPIVNCPRCGQLPVPDQDLPVRLPENVEFKPTGDSPLRRCAAFVKTTCPQCGGAAERETDTIDTFIDSSWYFLRYLSPRLADRPWDDGEVDYWMPVDQYIGGVEHSTMHLVYFRFLTLALKDLGLLKFEEPALRLFCQGMVCKVAHYCKTCKWVRETAVDLERGVCTTCGGPVVSEMAKISKTKLNTVSPDEIITEFGADTMRLNILSDNPPDQEQIWNDALVRGASKFINRLFTLVTEAAPALRAAGALPAREAMTPAERELYRRMHQVIGRATECFETDRHFNTVIAALHELVGLYRATPAAPAVQAQVIRTILLIFAPVIPHVCEELWAAIGGTGSIFSHPWPQADAAAAAADTIEVVLQVNGKVRSRLTVPAAATREELEAGARADAKVQAAMAGKPSCKVIVVPGKLVNIVV